MEREIVITGDGSSTIHMPGWNEQYHSKHGAIQEAYHVFIKHGLNHIKLGENNKLRILEIGFGTGLNAFITLLEAESLGGFIDYSSVEAYPVSMDEIVQLNYGAELKADVRLYRKLHEVSWGTKHDITPHFSFHKQNRFFSEIKDQNQYDLIYFDAFGARVQPELWTEAIFLSMYQALKAYGVLVTYSAKGSVRRAMQAVGFKVERLPGPPGKREMLRACKEG